ncbi:MAG: hypothetical protein DRP95_03920 [Candidatus Latescibacterota bacterium]|nr:MAG: hypothetical protein DRP95_03920 [Candidatus Latescibacterota bacterium]
MKFLSHPDKSLKEHLLEVSTSAGDYIEVLPLRKKETLMKAARLIGLAHDFGKYSSFFQAHLGEGKNFGPLQHHAFISALLGTWLLRRELKDTMSAEGPEGFLPLIAYIVIHRHHGDLKSPELIIPYPDALEDPPDFMLAEGAMREHLKALWAQKDDLKKEPRYGAMAEELKTLGIEDIGEFISGETFIFLLKNLFRLNWFISQGSVPEETRLTVALWPMLLFSALIDADKRGAARVGGVTRREIPGDLADRYVKEKFSVETNPLDFLRREVYREVVGNISRPLDELWGRVLTLTAPTGSGKTLTAFSFALKLRERIYKEKGFLPRIVYALPFISIIEQNYEVFRDVLKQLPDFSRNEHVYLLKHHHLSDVRYREGDEDRRVDEALLLTEAWESEVIVTTFVQLLHTVIGFKNRFLKKFHNIAGSILILDEAQNIPVEKWPLVRNFFKLLSESLGITVIQMTATRPLIFEDKETLELVPQPGKYFTGLRRTVVKARTRGKISLDTFTEEVREHWDKKTSLLVVVNTISMSVQLYSRLKDELSLKPFIGYPEDDDQRLSPDEVPIIYLSTNIVPLQRVERIRFLQKWLKAGRPALVVSTQVIEAGVDLDFHQVMRDIGPLDSIVQVAGRCNRSAKREQPGIVRVYHLEEGGARYVYGAIHLHNSLKMLEDGEYTEDIYIRKVEDFYRNVYESKDTEESEKIWKAFSRLDFYRDDGVSVSDFQLIEEGPQVPIFVVLTTKDENILSQFKNKVLQEKDRDKRMEAYLSLRRPFHERLVTPRLERAKNLPPEVEGSRELRHIPTSQLEEFYNLETGFIWLPGEEGRIW